jgi:hypothetical protein
MSRTSEIDRVDFLAGEIHALLSFVLAVAGTHPNRTLLKQHFEASSQVALAKIEMSEASDKTVSGFQYIAKEISTMFEE